MRVHWLLLGMKNRRLLSSLTFPPLHPSRQKLFHKKNSKTEILANQAWSYMLISEKSKAPISLHPLEKFACLSWVQTPWSRPECQSHRIHYPPSAHNRGIILKVIKLQIWKKGKRKTVLGRLRHPRDTSEMPSVRNSQHQHHLRLPINSHATTRSTKCCDIKPLSGTCSLLSTIITWT